MAVHSTVHRVSRRERDLRQARIRAEEARRSGLRSDQLRRAQTRRKRVEAVKAVLAFLATMGVFVFLYWLANTDLH
jgi:hypothetical protein